MTGKMKKTVSESVENSNSLKRKCSSSYSSCGEGESSPSKTSSLTGSKTKKDSPPVSYARFKFLSLQVLLLTNLLGKELKERFSLAPAAVAGQLFISILTTSAGSSSCSASVHSIPWRLLIGTQSKWNSYSYVFPSDRKFRNKWCNN